MKIFDSPTTLNKDRLINTFVIFLLQDETKVKMEAEISPPGSARRVPEPLRSLFAERCQTQNSNSTFGIRLSYFDHLTDLFESFHNLHSHTCCQGSNRHQMQQSIRT